MKKASLILSAVLMTIMSLTQVKAQESMSKLASTLFDYTEEENEAISTSRSQSSDLVDKYYCRDLKNDARSHLRLLVQNAQISEKTADIRYYLINQSCESAINRGLTEKQFETIFEPVSQEDCERIPDDLKKIMKYYDETSIKYVTEKMMKSCSDALANKDNRLDVMVQSKKYLIETGVIELEVPSIEWWK